MLCSQTAHPDRIRNSPKYIGFLVTPKIPVSTSDVAASGCKGFTVVSAKLNFRMALPATKIPLAASTIAKANANGMAIG